MLFLRNLFLNPTMWEQVETSKVISFRYKFVSRFNMKYIFFFGRHEVHVRKVMKMPNQSPNSQIDTKGQNLSPSTD